jgi:hypothetical protein
MEALARVFQIGMVDLDIENGSTLLMRTEISPGVARLLVDLTIQAHLKCQRKC